jgi:hypothetical protein
MVVWGQVCQSLSQLGLCALAMALLSGLSLQPNPSRIMSKTGVTFMLEFSGSSEFID